MKDAAIFSTLIIWYVAAYALIINSAGTLLTSVL